MRTQTATFLRIASSRLPGAAVRLASAFLAGALLMCFNGEARAETAAETLRSYLNARLAGDLETARDLWVRQEMRRSRAMGMRFENTEAAYDENWLMSAEERQRFAEHHTLNIGAEESKEDVAHFEVDVVTGKDPSRVLFTWRYLVQQTDDGWRVALPLTHDTRNWTHREGRYVTARSERLTRINREAVHAMDTQIESLLVSFGSPKAARLRLERVKYEVFIFENEASAQKLLGSGLHLGYLPGNERILTTAVADLAAITNAVATLTLRKTPPAAPDFFTEGLGSAWGGRDELSANVLITRTRNKVLRGELSLNLAFSSPKDKNAGDIQALWNHALFGMLGADGFFELYSGMRGTRTSVRETSPEDIRHAIEAATGKRGKKLEESVLAQLAQLELTIECGCDQWPPEVRNLRSIMSWQDMDSDWAMRGYETGEFYTIAIGAHRHGMPTWALDYVDSIATAHGATTLSEREPEPGRPSGDPPYFFVTFGPRFMSEPEPYESRIYGKLFPSRDYMSELLGFFVSHDMVRMYDYRIERIIAEYEASNAAPGDPQFYDEELGRVCFRIRKSVFPKPIYDYTPRSELYTGQ